jgi:hypothetical protein
MSFPLGPDPIIGTLEFNKLFVCKIVSVSDNFAHIVVEDTQNIKATKYSTFKLVRLRIVKLAIALRESLINRQIIDE